MGSFFIVLLALASRILLDSLLFTDILYRTRLGMLLAWLFADDHREVLLLLLISRFARAEVHENRRRRRGRDGVAHGLSIGQRDE